MIKHTKNVNDQTYQKWFAKSSAGGFLLNYTLESWIDQLKFLENNDHYTPNI